MRCERAQELFSDYCEGRVHHTLLVPLEAHLDECAECHALVTDLKGIWQMLDSAPIAEPPAHFRAAVWQRIDESESRRRERRFRLSFPWQGLTFRPAYAWAAAALLLILVGGVAVPGHYVGANLGFPWSVFQRTPTVTAGQPQMREGPEPGGSYLEVPLRSDSHRVVRVTSLTPEVATTAEGASADARVDVGGPSAGLVALYLRGNAWPDRVVLQVIEEGRHGATQDIMVDVRSH